MKKLLDSLLSGLLSFITPGLGQLRNGQLLKGIVFFLLEYLIALFLIWIGLYKTFHGMILMVAIAFGLLIYIIFDAFYIAFKTKMRIKESYNKWPIYVLLIIFNIILAGKFKSFINSNWLTAHKIPTSSMEPTLKVGDYLIADYHFYKNHPMLPGDIIVMRYPKNTELKYVERCIAVGGQVVEIRNKSVYVDGKRFEDSLKTQFIDPNIYSEDYADPQIYPGYPGNRDNYGPVRVPDKHYFVLGDNRDNSSDSRFWGFVPLNLVLAKPLYIYWSPDKSRIGTYIN